MPARKKAQSTLKPEKRKRVVRAREPFKRRLRSAPQARRPYINRIKATVNPITEALTPIAETEKSLAGAKVTEAKFAKRRPFLRNPNGADTPTLSFPPSAIPLPFLPPIPYLGTVCKKYSQDGTARAREEIYGYGTYRHGTFRARI